MNVKLSQSDELNTEKTISLFNPNLLTSPLSLIKKLALSSILKVLGRSRDVKV